MLKKKILSALCVFAAALLLCLPFAGFGTGKAAADFTPVPTDAGDFNDYDDGGGSDWGGSSDSDSGWGNDSDSDWGGGGYGGDSDFDAPSFIIILAIGGVVGIVVIILTVRQRKAKHKGSGGSFASPFDPAGNANAVVVRDHTPEIVPAIQKYDPYFSSGRFIEWAEQVFFTLQNAWMARDLSPVREIETEELYNKHQMQIGQYLALGRVNVLERINVNQAYLQKYVRDRDFEYLTVFLETRMTDYIIDIRSGKVLKGSRDRDCHLKYLYTFTRKTGSGSQETKSGVCPHCSAPYTLTDSGKCDHCGGNITVIGDRWRLSDIDAVKAHTVIDDSAVIIRG